MFRNDNDGHNKASGMPKEETIPLPRLPPLNTNSSLADDSDSNNDEVSIGWTPVSEHHYHQYSHHHHHKHHSQTSQTPQTPPQASLKQSVSNNYLSSPSQSSSSLKKQIGRRPPPPHLPNEFASPTSPLGITPTRRHSKPTYKSPFVGEAELQTNQESTPTKFYRSPFVGEQDIGLPTKGSPGNNLLTKQSNESMPYVSFDNTDYSTRALPPLPYNDITGKQRGPKFEVADFSQLPPPPLQTGTRNASGHSKFSDSIESYYSDTNYAFNNSNARHSSFNSLFGGKPLDQAPSITAPTQPFTIDSLDENKLYQCYSAYRLSDIYEWILKVYFEWFNEYVFGKIEFFQMVQLLLEFQMPKSFDQDTIDSNVDRIIESLVVQKAVRFELDHNDDITIIVAGLDISGIFTQLLPCYSFMDTTYGPTDTLCYSLTCVNRLQSEARQEIKLSEIINKSVGLWTDYWKLTPDDIAEINPREVQKQSFIFDLIILEERSLNMANAAIEIYGKRFDPSLLPDEEDFAACAFEIFQPLIYLHKEYLLTQMLWKLKTRGKFIDGVGKIYLKWCNEAREIYLKYASAMATVHEVISWEKQHKTKFADWLADIDNSPEITRSKMYHDVIFFGGFFKSLQNLPVTLSSILKNTEPSAEDYEYLKMVIAEVENLGAEVDRVHGAAIDQRSLVRFSKQLVFRSNGHSNTVGYVNLVTTIEGEDSKLNQDRLDLGLADPERKLLMSGNVLKKRELWLDPMPVYIVLLDNYFLVTEVINKGNQKRFKLAERPIPIDYLSLEQRKTQDMPQSSNDSERDPITGDKRSIQTPIMNVRPHLINAASTVSRSLYNSTNNEKKSGITEISNANPSLPEFSFKIRNTATNESFTFYTNTLEECQRWICAFMTCFRQSSERDSMSAFGLQVLSTQFAYSDKDAPVNLPVAPEGSEIDIALKRHERKLGPSEAANSLEIRPTTIFCSVNLELEGKTFLFVATDYGVLLRCENDCNENFIKILQTNDVKKMEANVKLGLLFVLDNRLLCYFNISSLLGAYEDPEKYLTENRIVGVVISDKVGCFKVAEDFGNSKHLLYERKGRIIVLTPEYDRLTKLLKFFKIYKEYRLPTFGNGLLTPDVEDIVVFQKSFVVCTSKGALLYHDSFNDEGIVLPSFLNDRAVSSYMKHPHLNSNPFKTAVESSSKKDSSKQKMAEYVKKDVATNKTKPKTCFQINNSKNYLLVYDEAVVKIDCQGQISDWKTDILVLDFYCTGASFCMGYLTLVADNLVQIYNLRDPGVVLSKMVPIQIIKGKKVKLISCNKRSDAVIALSHPNIAKRQLLLGCSPRNL